MHKIADFIVKNKKIILILNLLLLIPAIIGFSLTKTNYDILVYLPYSVNTYFEIKQTK